MKNEFDLLIWVIVRPGNCNIQFSVSLISKHSSSLWNIMFTAARIKMVKTRSNLEYSERLKKLNLTTLSCRRASRGDMLETFIKYLNGQYNTAPILHLDTRTHGTTTRGHQLKLEKGRSRLDVRKHFFTQRAENLVSAPTVNAFKNQIDKLWKDAPFTTDPNATNIYYTIY